MLLPVLAFALATMPAQRVREGRSPLFTKAPKRVVWLPTTALPKMADSIEKVKAEACRGVDAGLASTKAPYQAVPVADVQAAVKANDLKTATGGSPEDSAQNWSSEGARKIAAGFKADYYGMVKITSMINMQVPKSKTIVIRSLVSLYDATGHAVAENVQLNISDTTPYSRVNVVAVELGRTVIANWYRTTVLKAK